MDPALLALSAAAIEAQTKENIQIWTATVTTTFLPLPPHSFTYLHLFLCLMQMRQVLDYVALPTLHWRYVISAAIFMVLSNIAVR